MSSIEQFESLKNFPEKILDKFLDLLEDDDQIKVIKERLNDTGIILEYENYQISIATTDELEELLLYVEKYFEEVKLL